jgi:hypothetical protein
MSTLPQALNWKVTASMDIVTAMFEARYPGEWTFDDFAGGVTLQGGYKNEDGSVELVDIFTSGIIDSVRAIHAPTGPVTEVKGRDAGYTLTDNIALIQFLSQDAIRSPVLPLRAPLHGGIDTAELSGILPPPPSGWSRVVATSAAQCCRAVLGGGSLLFGTWDYPVVASFVSRGHKIDALRTLLGPQSLLEVSRPYIWHRHDGVFVVAPLGGGASADWDLDASEWLLSGDVTISEQPGPKYAHWLLTGGPDVSFIGDVYAANSQPTTSVVFGYDAHGVLVSSSTSVSVGRKEDGAVQTAIRFTWGPDPDNADNHTMVELTFETTGYTWEDPIIGSKFQLLNRPVLLRQSTWHQTRVAVGDFFELRPSAHSITGYDYDVFKVSTGSTTLTEELDPETGTTVRVTISSESLNRVLNMTLRTTLSPDAVGSQAFISGGLPAGGAGSNAQLPACLREGSAGVGWTDVELGNGNLSNVELGQIVGRIGTESGQIKGEVAFECASLPQLHLGDLATIRRFPLPNGSLRTFRGQVATLVSSYSQTGGLVQALTLRYWRAA